jgi:hypothetical protein
LELICSSWEEPALRKKQYPIQFPFVVYSLYYMFVV